MWMILLKILNDLGVGIIADAVDYTASLLIPCVNSNATINGNGGVMIGY